MPYSGATVISAGNLNLGGSTATGSLTSPTLTLGGGTFSYTRTGSTTQSFTTTNFNSAPTSVLTVASGNTLNLGSIVRGAGVFYDFSTIPGGGTVGASTSNNSAAGIMNTAFRFGDSWAVANPTGVTAYSGSTLTSVAGVTAGNYTSNNMDVDSSEGALSAGITTNSIRFSEADANTMTLTGVNVISSGGILVASTVGSNLSTITGGTSLTGPASGALVIQQNNTSGGLTIGTNIINNTATPLDKLGSGTLTLSGTNTYTGTTTIYGGTLAVSGGAAIANTGLVTLANTAGVTFQLNSNETIGNLSGGGTTGGTVALGANTLTVGDGNAQTYSGNFTGTSGSSIIKQGSQTLTLAATSIPGTATINAGMLAFSSNTTVSGGTITLGANSSGLLFTGGGSAGVSGTGGTTISNNIVLGNSVTTTGARLWATANSGRFNFTGNITGAAGAAGAQTLLFDTRGGAGTGGDRHTTTISGVIANGNQALNLNFAITPQTSSTAANNHPTYVNLTGLNTFTGSITATRANAGATSWLVIGGERWSDGPNNTPTYGRMGSGRLGDNNSGVYAGNFALGGTAGNHVNLSYFSSANQTWSGTIGTGGVNNNGALIKEGTGTLTLTNANLYNSLTTIGGGTLALGFDTTTSNILPTGTALWMGLGSTYDPITANADMTMATGPSGGTLQLGGTAASATQTVASLNTAANTASSILVGADRTLTITSPTITIGTNSGLNFNTVVGGNNGATVGTSIVQFGGVPTAFTNGFTVTDAGGFGLAAVNGSNQVIRDATTTLLPASGAASPTNYRIDNVSVVSTDPGSSTLAVTADQSSGSVTVDTAAANGVLTLNSGVQLSTNTWNFGGTGTNTYQITGSAGGAGLQSVASANTITINNYNAGTVTLTSPILAFGANAVFFNGTGATVLGGANTYTGATSITGGTLRVTGNLVAAYNAAITISSGATFQYSSGTNLTLGTSANITGGGGLTLDGGKDLTLQGGTSTWTGPTLITGNNSRLVVGNVAGSLSSGTSITISGNGSGGGQLYNSVASTTLPNNFTISGVGLAEADAQSNFIGAIRVQNTTLSGTITLAGNSRIGSFGNTTNTISGRITGGFGIDFWGMVSANTQVPTFVLSNTNNNYTGNTTIYASQFGTNNPTTTGTTLKLGASNVIPDGASAGNVAFALNGTNSGGSTVTLDLNGFNETINGLTVNAGTFATRITNTAAAANSVLTIGANDTTSSFNGTITDSGAGRTLAITKIGTATLTLSSPNTYIGLTTVGAGTLQLGANNTIASGNAVTVAPTGVSAVLDLAAFNQTIGGAGLTLGGATTSSAASVTGTGTSTLTLSGGATAVTYNAASNPLGATIATTTVDLANAAQTFTVGDSSTVTGSANELTVTSAITAAGASSALVKEGAGALRLDGAQGYNILTANAGTTNVNGVLGTAPGLAVVTVGAGTTKVKFGTVSQTLSSLTIGAGSTVIFTSGTASGSLADGGGKAAGFGTSASSFSGSATVPEPGTIGLLLVGALGVLNRRRRRA